MKTGDKMVVDILQWSDSVSWATRTASGP